MQDALLTAAQAGALLGVSEWTMRRIREDVGYVMVAGSIRFERATLDSYVARNRAGVVTMPEPAPKPIKPVAGKSGWNTVTRSNYEVAV